MKDDALRYFYERMAVTYMLLSKEQAAAYYCLLNDKITFDTSRKNEISFWNRFNRKNKIPNPKRRQNYPAVKLGRFAVSSHFQGQGIGRLILDGVKANVNPKNRYGVSLFNR
ncbi:MAG: GNAT family N-acetyltransferase [Prevotellaceae bacterium]|nr:GNAT family N-acetyltransferase [Prevotellaceae bacterium]